MEFGVRTFLVVEGKIRRIGVKRFSRLSYDGMTEFARRKIPYALLVFTLDRGKLSELYYHECGYLVFDKLGKVDDSSQSNQVFLTQAGLDDPRSFAARRAKQIRRENTWNPTGQQLDQMTALVKKTV